MRGPRYARARAVRGEARVDLGGELAGRRHDGDAAASGCGPRGRAVQALDDGEGESRGLAGSGLGAAQKIAPREQGGNRGRLYGSRDLVALRLHGGQDGLDEAQRRESWLVHSDPYSECLMLHRDSGSGERPFVSLVQLGR